MTTIDNAAQPCLSLPIPDNGCVVLPVTVSGAPGTSGTDVHLEKVDLIVQHVRDADLDISLQSPNGTEIDLTSDNGSFGDHYGNPAACPGQVTSFASWAGSSITAGAPPYIGNYMPEGAFSSFNGSNANGNWTLRVCDTTSSNAVALCIQNYILHLVCAQSDLMAPALQRTAPLLTGRKWAPRQPGT